MHKHDENKLNTIIDKSGNSDVDLIVNIETKAIAYSVLCSLYAKGDINEDQLDKAVRKLDSLIERDKNKEKRIRENHVVELRPRNRMYTNHQSRRKWI